MKYSTGYASALQAGSFPTQLNTQSLCALQPFFIDATIAISMNMKLRTAGLVKQLLWKEGTPSRAIIPKAERPGFNLVGTLHAAEH